MIPVLEQDQQDLRFMDLALEMVGLEYKVEAAILPV